MTSRVSDGQQVRRTVLAVHRLRLLARVHLGPGDLAPALVGLGDGGVQHPDGRRPDVGPGAVALDEGNDWVVGHLELAVADRDLLARGNLHLAGH